MIGWSKMNEDKGVRFLVGCFVLFAGWKLYQSGWLSFVFGDTVNGTQVGDANAIAVLIEAVVQAVDLVGYVAILLVSGAWPTIQSIIRSITRLLDPESHKTEGDEIRDRIEVLRTEMIAEIRKRNEKK